ncbi:SDR family NAD(P)-dependent oxidoreductase, partial [Aliarcobacter butzleri]
FITTTYQSVQTIIATSFCGTFLFTREVSKVMMKQKFGRIVNYTTVAEPLRLEGESIYDACKAAIENFTQTIAKEVTSYGIT